VKACTERGILVVNQAGGNAESVAEHVLGMLLSLTKRVVECDRALRAGTLTDRAAFTGREAYGKTIGIVGIGNVGRRVAELCRGLCRMEVLAYDPMSTPRRRASAAPARSYSTSCCAAPMSSRSIAR
jgi:D-3-phosphoglycerate dehydrogenase / 2-oxoglutarate reductase